MRKIPASQEVWAVIWARHKKDLVVFSGYSNPNGGEHGSSPDIGVMMTEYGFVNADFPLIGIETKWDIDPEHDYKRVNERNEYWLCLPAIEP